MFHDPNLERTTGMKAIIRESNWHGDDGINKARTLKTPHLPIPTFAETVDLLMKVRSCYLFSHPIPWVSLGGRVPDADMKTSFHFLAARESSC
jgi:hypothetical protein